MILFKIFMALILFFLFSYLVLPQFLRRTKWGLLHPSVAQMIFLRKLIGDHIFEDDLDNFRIKLLKNIKLLEGVRTKMHRVGERSAETEDYNIPFKFYIPSDEKNLPVTIYYHGGGFICGGIKSVDTICRHIAKNQNTLVLSVEYPLAPENRFPIPVEACYSFLTWAYKNCRAYQGDPEHIRVAGESAGGNLATIMPFLSRDRRGPKIEAQLLFYPWVDLSNTDTESFHRYGVDYLLSYKEINWFTNLYLNEPSDALLPEVSPLLHTDFSNIPPAVIVASEFDVLHDQAFEYYQKLKIHGVPASFIEMKGMPHGALSMTGWMRHTLIGYYKSIGQALSDLLNAVISPK
ncbi:MAG: alpha/beta hydrolase [Spirochaetales bacterium]|nr:alpha/beta hydrolase [Spirochaetales bacterium]